MTHQYGAQRFRYRPVNGKTKAVGTIPTGTIVYIQDSLRPLSLLPRRAVCRDPWIVTAWLNREYRPAAKGQPRTTYMRGGHLAVVRSLRDGRTKQVADWILLQCVDAGLERVQ